MDGLFGGSRREEAAPGDRVRSLTGTISYSLVRPYQGPAEN